MDELYCRCDGQSLLQSGRCSVLGHAVAQLVKAIRYKPEGIWLVTLPPSFADCLEIWDPQPSGTLRACPGL
jgi:hypothetical protein